MGKLFICATPIGNLEDVSFRLLRVLKEVDLIACEDTRQTGKLLKHYEIKNRLVSYHSYSESSREDYLLEELRNGKNVALVSDAGMPGVSDPGSSLIRRVIDEGLELDVVPGPSAFTAALALSGFDTASFVFEGFLPRRDGKRRSQIEELRNEKRTIVIYEAPHRLLDTLKDVEEILGNNRLVAVARELTKKYEEVQRGPVTMVKNHFENNPPRGEICLVISGNVESPIPEIDIVIKEVELLIEQGMDRKQALKLKARQYNLPKSDLYKLLTNKKQDNMY